MIGRVDAKKKPQDFTILHLQKWTCPCKYLEPHLKLNKPWKRRDCFCYLNSIWDQFNCSECFNCIYLEVLHGPLYRPLTSLYWIHLFPRKNYKSKKQISYKNNGKNLAIITKALKSHEYKNFPQNLDDIAHSFFRFNYFKNAQYMCHHRYIFSMHECQWISHDKVS